MSSIRNPYFDTNNTFICGVLALVSPSLSLAGPSISQKQRTDEGKNKTNEKHENGKCGMNRGSCRKSIFERK